MWLPALIATVLQKGLRRTLIGAVRQGGQLHAEGRVIDIDGMGRDRQKKRVPRGRGERNAAPAAPRPEFPAGVSDPVLRMSNFQSGFV
jgi:hypothetical protein